MTRVEAAGRFPVPVEYGFDFITDVGNWPRYWPGLLEIVEAEPSWGRPGDEVHVVMRFLSGPVEVAMALEEFRPAERVVYRSAQTGLPAARHERHFRADDGGFEYRLVVEFEPRRGGRGARRSDARRLGRAADVAPDAREPPRCVRRT